MKKMILFLAIFTAIVQTNSPLDRVKKHLEGLLTLRDEIILKMSNTKQNFNSNVECSVKVPYSSREYAFVVQTKDTIEAVTRGEKRKDLQKGNSQLYEFYKKQTPLHHYTFAGDTVIVSDKVKREFLIGQHKETKKLNGLLSTQKVRNYDKKQTVRVEIYKPFLYKHLGCFRNVGISRDLVFNVLKGINIGLSKCASECEGEYAYMGYQENICFCGRKNENYSLQGENDSCRDGHGSAGAMDVYSLDEITWPVRGITNLTKKCFDPGLDNISKMLVENGIPFDGKFLEEKRWWTDRWSSGPNTSLSYASAPISALSYAISNYSSMKETTMSLLKNEKNKNILEDAFVEACLTENVEVVTFMLQYCGFTAAHALKVAHRKIRVFNQLVHFSTDAFVKFLHDWEKKEKSKREDKK